MPASCELNISAIDLPEASADSCKMPRTSVRLMPESINSLKLCPVFFFRVSLAVLPLLPSSFNIPLMYVVDSAVAIPFFVVVT